MRLVIIESPYAGDIELNLKYLRAAMRDCLLKGEVPFASHALYTQPGVLDDSDPQERKLGIEAGFKWAEAHPEAVRVVYVDLGISSGMDEGIRHAHAIGQQIEYRELNSFFPEIDALWKTSTGQKPE